MTFHLQQKIVNKTALDIVLMPNKLTHYNAEQSRRIFKKSTFVVSQTTVSCTNFHESIFFRSECIDQDAESGIHLSG